MKQLKQILTEYLVDHPIDFGTSDAKTILDFLNVAYSEAHESDPPYTKTLFTQLCE